MAGVVIFPVLWTVLGVTVTVFWLAELAGGNQWIDDIGEKCGGGLSIANWVSPVSELLSTMY